MREAWLMCGVFRGTTGDRGWRPDVEISLHDPVHHRRKGAASALPAEATDEQAQQAAHELAGAREIWSVPSNGTRRPPQMQAGWTRFVPGWCIGAWCHRRDNGCHVCARVLSSRKVMYTHFDLSRVPQYP